MYDITTGYYNWIKFRGCSSGDDLDLHVTVYLDRFLIIKPSRWTDFSNLFLEENSTCFGQFLCPLSGVFHCTHSNVICHTGLLTACEQDQDGTAVISWFCSQDVSKPVWLIPLLCTVKNFWWLTEELPEICRVPSKNKFEKLVYVVGFIIRNSGDDLWTLSDIKTFQLSR
jgi:hypothetical protein